MLSLYFVSVFSVGGRRHPRNARGMGNGTSGNLAIDLANTPAGGEALGRLQAVVALTDAERLGFGTWTQGELKKLSRVPPPILWHYTDGNSLIAILKSGALWATQVSCLNDYSELSYAMRLVRTELEQQRIAHSNNRPVLLMLDSAIDGLQDRHAATNEWFVACLSENGDDLSQWRGYGAGEGGYSIGLSSGALAVAGAQQSHFLAPVNYDAPTHAALARAIALEIVKTFNQGLSAVPARANVLATWIDQFLDAWKNRLTYTSHRFLRTQRFVLSRNGA